MPFTQHFIIEGRHLGTCVRNYRIVHAEVQPPPSYAFFCPTCADLWARCPVEVAGEATPFQVLTKACRKHTRHDYEVAGSLWLVWDKTFNDGFPEDVMKWELARHLALYDEGK